MSSAFTTGCSCGQHMVDQGPKYDNQVRKKRRRVHKNQALGRSGILRPDKRFKTKTI